LCGLDNKYIGGFQRCGVSAPGYPDRATYSAYPFNPANPIYIYDGGYFWPSREWHAYYRQHHITPAEAQANIASTGIVAGGPVSPANMSADGVTVKGADTTSAATIR